MTTTKKKRTQRLETILSVSFLVDKPEDTNFTTNHYNHIAKEGDTVIFTCNSVSHPLSNHQFYFRRDGSTKVFQADTSDRKFVIGSVRPDQQGWYFCTPYNSIGNGPEKSLFLTVNGKTVVLRFNLVSFLPDWRGTLIQVSPITTGPLWGRS